MGVDKGMVFLFGVDLSKKKFTRVCLCSSYQQQLVVSGENEPLSDPPSPRCIEEDEPVAICMRKRVNNSPPISSFLDMTFWRR